MQGENRVGLKRKRGRCGASRNDEGIPKSSIKARSTKKVNIKKGAFGWSGDWEKKTGKKKVRKDTERP